MLTILSLAGGDSTAVAVLTIGGAYSPCPAHSDF